jgi:hypothetical protein
VTQFFGGQSWVSYVVLLRGFLRLVESDVDLGERVANSVAAPGFAGGGRSARCAGVAGVAGQRGMVYGFERAVAGLDAVGLEGVCVASFPRWERRIVAVGVCWGTLGGDGVTHLI